MARGQHLGAFELEAVDQGHTVSVGAAVVDESEMLERERRRLGVKGKAIETEEKAMSMFGLVLAKLGSLDSSEGKRYFARQRMQLHMLDEDGAGQTNTSRCRWRRVRWNA